MDYVIFIILKQKLNLIHSLFAYLENIVDFFQTVSNDFFFVNNDKYFERGII